MTDLDTLMGQYKDFLDSILEVRLATTEWLKFVEEMPRA